VERVAFQSVVASYALPHSLLSGLLLTHNFTWKHDFYSAMSYLSLLPLSYFLVVLDTLVEKC